MWILRVLKGPQRGQTFELRQGPNLIGRGSHCNIQLEDNGVSKEHANILVKRDTLTLTDLNSSNGTFVNGLQVKTAPLNPGDKLGFHRVLVDLQKSEASTSLVIPGHSPGGLPALSEGMDSLPDLQSPDQSASSHDGEDKPEPTTFGGKAERYVDDVVLPGVYKLAEIAEMRWVLGLFVLGFVILVTALSIVPLTRIYQTNIENEIADKVKTYAEELAGRYSRALRNNAASLFDTRFISKRRGVVGALIVSAVDGSIMAPATNVGGYSKLPFVYKARKDNYDKTVVEILENSIAGASVPIRLFEQESGEYSVHAHSIVLYDMTTLTLDEEQAISLLVQVLLIALVLGSILFFFLWKLIEHPVKDLNQQIDRALKEGRDHTSSSYNFPALQNLILNINSALSRAIHGDTSSQSLSLQDRQSEATNLVQLLNIPAIAIDGSETIIFINSYFEDLSGMRLATVEAQNLEILSDQALKESIQHLMEQNRNEPHLIATHQLDFAGQPYTMDAQAIQGASAIAYHIIAIRYNDEGGGDYYDS
jgi:hypothetical protein